MSFSTATEIAMLDTRGGSGFVPLPLTTQIPFRILTFKDIYGTTGVSTIRLNTTGSDTFEDGTTQRTLNANFGAVTLYAGQPGVWYTVGGSFWTTFATSTLLARQVSTQSLNVSSINGQTYWAPELSSLQGLGTLGYVSSSQLVSTTGGVTSNVSTFLSTTLATYSFPYSGETLYLNYTRTVAPYFQLGINNIIGTNASNVSTINGNTSNVLIAGFQTDFTLPQFIPTGLWTMSLFSQASGTGLSVYTSLFQRDPSTAVEALIATSSNSPFIVPTTKVSLDLTVDVPYYSLSTGNTLVMKIFANNSGSPSRDLTTFYENGNYSHVHTTLGPGAIATNLFQSSLVGLGSMGYISTSQLVSTVRGLGSAGYLSTATAGGTFLIPSTFSTVSLLTSSLTASTATITSGTVSSIVTNTMTIGAGSGWILTSPIQAAALSTNTLYADVTYVNTETATTAVLSTVTTNQLTVGTGGGWLLTSPIQTSIVSSVFAFANQPFFDTVNVGSVSTMNSLEFAGLYNAYTNTVLAEISTGAGTQEFLVFKGSSASDRVRVQTTGTFVVETGVSARLWNSNTTQTLSNVTPAFIINTSSNVGIQTANPGATLDVAGSGRFQAVSTQAIFASSIVAPYVFASQFLTF